jgi:O-antigen/teichoic acid export membrane protein
MWFGARPECQMPVAQMTGVVRVVARNAGVQAAADLLGKIATLTFFVVMARTLGQAGFGDFTFALSLALILTMFAEFGTDPHVARSVATDRSTAVQLLTDALTVKLALGVVGIAAAVTVGFVGGYPADVRASIAILALAAVTELASKSFASTFQGLDDMRPIALSLILQRFVTAGVGVAAMLAGAGIVAVSAIYLGAALLALVYISVRLSRLRITPRAGVSPPRAAKLLRATVAIGLNLMLTSALFRIDAVLLSLIKGNAAVGLYGVAYRLLESTLFVSYTFVAALLPTLARLSPRTTPSIGEAFEVGLKLITTALLPLGAIFVLFAEPIVKILYSSEFDEAVVAVRLLGVAAALYGVTYLSGYVLISQGLQRMLPRITATALVLNVVGNLIVIPIYSYKGAAAVTSLSELTMAVLSVACVLRMTGSVSLRRIASAPVVGCAAMVTVAAIAGTGVLGLVLAVLAYPLVVLSVERQLFPADVRLVAAVFRRRSPMADPVLGGEE